MDKYHSGIIIALMCMSVAVLLVPSVIYSVCYVIKRATGYYGRRPVISNMLVFACCILVSVWCLRYAVEYFSIISADADVLTLTWWEEIFSSLVHALKTFGIDESYVDYIIDGKVMLGEIFGANEALLNSYGLYASLLNFIAPVIGGAIIFEILISIFPRFKLFLACLIFWREKYYFSVLNEGSMALAKNIYNTKTSFFRKPFIVFADAYAESDSKKGTERLLEAKRMGAVCVRDDLHHIRKNKLGLKKFFLISEKEEDNLTSLSELVNSADCKYLKNSETYLFTNDDAYIQLERRTREKLVSVYDSEKDSFPVFVPVLNYQNLTSVLLAEVPLYEPLVGKKRNADGSQSLTVTILGAGNIGTEMFLSAYWFGQMLDCRLKINVISEESEEEFWGKIDYINPEIKHTTIAGDPILTINRKGDIADVYCDVEYRCCDVRSTRFIEALTDKNILGTDYFFVALGSDEVNISVADTIKSYIGQHHIESDTNLKTVITYVVYNSKLASTLNKKKLFSFVGGGTDVYMQAVGSLEEVYSIKNVFMAEYEPYVRMINDSYEENKQRKDRASAYKKCFNDGYKHRSSRARSMHVGYKMYSAGLIKTSVFDFSDSLEEYHNRNTKAYEDYKRIWAGETEYNDPERESEFKTLLHRLAWLEHRRWNAYLRAQGLRHTGAYDVYAKPGEMGSYKQMELKLHPCLVECDQKGIKGKINSNGTVDKDSLFRCDDRTDFDLLDDLSYDIYNKYNDYDFKQNDYPIK